MNLARELKNDALIAQVLNFQGDGAFWSGHLNPAAGLYERALKLAAESHDQSKVILSKVNLAKVAVKERRSREATSKLRALRQQADGLGLKSLSIECSVYLGEAMIDRKDYTQARQHLENDLGKSEKLGLRMQTARIHYLLGAAPYWQSAGRSPALCHRSPPARGNPEGAWR